MRMTKEKLLEYGDLVKEIKDLERRIKKLENQSEMVRRCCSKWCKW